jgi:type VI secretion system secreted protein Hcp
MAVDYFFDIDGIQGESEDSNHKDTIHVLSFSWGLKQPRTVGLVTGGIDGKVTFSDFSFTMQTCRASTKLMEACTDRKLIAKATLYCRRSTGDGRQQDYMTWTIRQVIVSSYHTGGPSGAEIPIDTVSLNYGNLDIEYKTLGGSQGSLTTTGTFKYPGPT